MSSFHGTHPFEPAFLGSVAIRIVHEVKGIIRPLKLPV
jgi:hypothetical protein